MRKNAITKTFTITASPEVMRRFERFLAFFHYNGGHTGTFAMDFDGDGSDYMKVDPPPAQEFGGDAVRIGGCTSGIELARDVSYWAIPLDAHRTRYRIKDGILERYYPDTDTYEFVRKLYVEGKPQ